MPLNKIIYTETVSYTNVVEGFSTDGVSADGATTLSAQANIDVTTPAAKTFDSGKLAVLVNQGITYTADTRGTAGNSITVAFINPGTPSAALDVPAVVGTAIVVNLATDAGTAASKIIQDLTYTADAVGTAGNSISVTYVDPAANDQALSVGVVGSAITVNLATGPAGAITSTAAEIKTAVDAFPAAAALVNIAVSGVGANVQTAQALTLLESGVNPAITSTADEVVTALGLVASVTALVDITGGGVGVVTALAATALATGADPEVNTADDEITIPSHGLVTGIEGQLTTTGTLPAGLSLATDYWVIVIDANTIQLASSYANAEAGTPVDITDQGANGSVNTFTATTAAGTVSIQKSNDNVNWLAIGSAENFSADEVDIFEVTSPGCLWYRLVFTMTAGIFDVDVIWVTKGPN